MVSDVTTDDFLGGRLTLTQPAKGYRAGVDPVLLAAAVPAKPGETVLELGCGTGAALLCLGARVPDLVLHGLELQKDYAELAAANASSNGIEAAVHCADLRHMPDELRHMSFDHVMANPPYFDRRSGTGSALPDRDLAFGGDTPLTDWIDAATRRLRPKGRLTLIQRTERLPDLMRALDDRLGSLVLRPIAGREGRPADRFLLSARKGGRTEFRMCSPLTMHAGPRHERDEDDYTAEIRAVLRDGAALPDPR